MTNQEAFTIIVQHLRTQGGPSKIGLNCVYRHPDGIKRCAVGVLIPDSEYTTDLEGNTVTWDPVKNLQCLQGINIHLLSSLQRGHDSVSYGNKSWLEHMELKYNEIAQYFGLVVPHHPCVVVEAQVPSQTQEWIEVPTK